MEESLSQIWGEQRERNSELTLEFDELVQEVRQLRVMIEGCVGEDGG